jgi:PPOX class probable F420-dependent enzyme
MDSKASQASEALAPLRTSNVALVTSFRRDGKGVGTPVGLGVKQDRAYFTTRSKTWKVKRLVNNPRITVAPCNKMGTTLGPTIEATARRLSEDEARALKPGFEYRVWKLIYRLFYRDTPVSYEVTPLLTTD